MNAEEEVKAVETISPVVTENDEKIQEALKDPTKKRKAEDEIEIDLKSSIPLSKKQKRLLRRGKITLEELNAKYNIDPASINEFKTESVSENGNEDAPGKESADKPKEEKFGVWIGNLSFDTTREDLMRFILGKTKQNEDSEKVVEEKDIVRFKLPLANNDGKKIKNKGFCYIDFSTEQKMKAVLELNENQLNGRNLLIKNSKNFEGRPDKNDLVSMSKNPPSRILFVGNLSFDTTDEVLKKHFQHCGEIIKIRMATFQDSGKCKGFAFVDFKSEEGATNALKDKTCRRIASRPIRMEYGEDRSKRQVIRKKPMEEQKSFDLPAATKETHSKPVEKKPFKPRNNRNKMMDSNNRVKSSVALAGAQRASAAIVPSQGKKVKFD
ncbi:hypothetical protein KAFR_0A07490 [Kazachstania africana CBS 2517]|uniref:RRM domain-containing protein n=1 Tax=Kazachstania africana (strain ATCC 22294 / BCRC 22015 / CBS 2517 / CECT 1963 / NBRC 1671 / NRRL Y-8276) TaxID=1071382 RepID=H2AP83_KAZAF|nr:hypothetical protein KAFR_0A07490 [Kazachstania africana CBS 2517]CCF56183.1 hypothetical protein KAFR_0A07490 [Kazachstania africana CBS 2517]